LIGKLDNYKDSIKKNINFEIEVDEEGDFQKACVVQKPKK